MRKALPILLAFLLLALSVVAAAFGMADIYRGEAATLIGEWDGFADEEGPPAWAWEQVHRYLWLASHLAPFDAQIQGDLGQLYERRVGEAAGARCQLTSIAPSTITGKRLRCARPGPMPGPMSRC